MIQKLSFSAVLLAAFLWLSAYVGAVPAETAADTTAPEGIETVPEFTPSPTPQPTVTPSPAPTEIPVPTEDPSVLSTTITGTLLENNTGFEVDADAILSEGVSLTLESEGYQILIIHTHGTEAYTPAGADVYEATEAYRTTDVTKSVIRVGTELARALESYGLHVLHDTALYDYPSYNGSYARCAEAIEEYLNAYPNIRIVIDLHRDALGEGDTIYKTVTDAAGTESAQLMFVMGSSERLEHPRWRENLALALTLQNAAQKRYATLMRPTDLCSYRYNQQLTAGSLLLEVGTAGNTLAEAITGVQLFADAVAPVLLGYVRTAD